MTVYENAPAILEWAPYTAQAAFVDDQSRNCGFVGGLGAGKTFSGWVKALQMTPDDGVGLIIAPTYAMLRDVVLATFREHFGAFEESYHGTEKRITLINGTQILLRSATKPERCKGINAGWVWFDEAALMSRRAIVDIGGRARVGAERVWWTTTPIKGSGVHQLYVQTDTARCYHAKSDDNPYLSREYIRSQRAIMSEREAARELDAEWVDAAGVLFNSDMLAVCRVDSPPAMTRVVVGVDPATTAKARSDRTGIVVVGRGTDGHAYVLADHSGQYAPHQWAQVVCDLCAQYKAIAVCEVNQGGDLVERNLRSHDARVGYIGVRASASKHDRAQPVAVLASRGWLHMVGVHRELERQMTTWEPTDRESPDRLDALVWAVSELQIAYIPPSPTRIVRGDDDRAPRVIA